jgi:signal transduction histidine kinase
LEEKKLNLIIKDNGIGITVEQANNSKSFGLFGMRERVRNMGGGINFVGEINKGTTVNILLPIKSE